LNTIFNYSDPLKFLAVVCGLLLSMAVRATVVEELTFEELVAGSGLIFQGEVTRSETETFDGLIYTRVWFEVEDYLKGAQQQTGLSLRFLGGSTVDATMAVSGQYIPAVGSRALFFVQDPFTDKINPFTGWQQGVLFIETSATGETLIDLRERPDLVLFNTRNDPLVKKMLQTGFSEDQISARFPQYQRFGLQDMKDAIRSLAGE
jgi:hypothetical protein